MYKRLTIVSVLIRPLENCGENSGICDNDKIMMSGSSRFVECYHGELVVVSVIKTGIMSVIDKCC